jgi:hypothetical protein
MNGYYMEGDLEKKKVEAGIVPGVHHSKGALQFFKNRPYPPFV